MWWVESPVVFHTSLVILCFICIYTSIHTLFIYLRFPVNPTIPIFSLHSPSIPFSKLSSFFGLPSVLLVQWFSCSGFGFPVCDMNDACFSLTAYLAQSSPAVSQSHKWHGFTLFSCWLLVHGMFVPCLFLSLINECSYRWFQWLCCFGYWSKYHLNAYMSFQRMVFSKYIPRSAISRGCGSSVSRCGRSFHSVPQGGRCQFIFALTV